MKTQYYLFPGLSFILGGIIVFNFFFSQNKFIGLFYGLSWLAFHGYFLGKIFFNANSYLVRFILGTVLQACLLLIINTTFYYFFNLSNFFIILGLFSTTGLTNLIILLTFKNQNMKINLPERLLQIKFVLKNHLTYKNIFLFFLIGAYLALIGSAFKLLCDYKIDQAVRSLWAYLPVEFFYFYFSGTLILLIFIIHNRVDWLSLFFVFVHIFISVSLATIVYPLGYGFDPFIHQATEKIIFAQGLISPKPLYYLGQYALVVPLAKLWLIDLVWLEKSLTALFFSTGVITAVYYAFVKENSSQNKLACLAGLTVLALPFGIFINTTPQSLANCLLIIVIFSGYYILNAPEAPSQKHLMGLLILSFACLLIHPMAGVPALLFTLSLLSYYWLKKPPQKILGQLIVGFLALISLPLLFIINNHVNANSPQAVINWSGLTQLFNFTHWLSWPYRYQPLKDFIYLYQGNLWWILLVSALIGLILKIKQNKARLGLYLVYFLIFGLNYLFFKHIFVFKNLAGNEQTVYGLRLKEISFYFLLPLILVVLNYGWSKIINKRPKIFLIFALLILTVCLTVSIYLSYPVDDGYNATPGFNVSAADFEAARYIEETAVSPNFAVLANQNVAAASLKEFGFKKYYLTAENETQFYYPLPTGSPLYQYYLDFMQSPNYQTIEKVKQLLQVDTVYVVVPLYWANSQNIIAKGQQMATTCTSLADNKIYVLKFE